MKFITTFSLLFGAGILLQGERLASRGISPARVHYLRMFVLLLLGLAHGHLIWYGDVLANYAVCGMLLFPLRRLPASVLIPTGIGFVAVASLYQWAVNQGVDVGVVHWLRNGSMGLTPPGGGGMDFEFEAYTGPWREQMASRFWIALDNETFSFLNWGFWRCGGCMLIGMGLLRLKFFHGEWSRGAYLGWALFAIPVGWLITTLGIAYNHQQAWWQGGYPDFFGMEFNYWGSLVAAIGYLALGVFVAGRLTDPGCRLLRKLAIPVRAVGRTALSNYLLQSFIGTTIFYGHGLGYFGYVSRAELVPIVFGVWAFQLTASPLYLRRFRQGPFEWMWHRIVYGCLGRNKKAPPTVDRVSGSKFPASNDG